MKASDYDRPFDIYYIVLDGYARGDILKEIYAYDNQPFLTQLEELGFYVADSSYANYNQTRLSIPSALNMAYMQDLGINTATPFNLPDHLELIRKAALFDFLK